MAGGVIGRLGRAREERHRRIVEPLVELRARAERDGLVVARVTELREVGVRGSKAWVELDDGARIDAWFWDDEPPVDCFLLLRACVREGTHSGSDVLFVGRGTPLEGGIVELLPPRVTAAAERLGMLHMVAGHGGLDVPRAA